MKRKYSIRKHKNYHLLKIFIFTLNYVFTYSYCVADRTLAVVSPGTISEEQGGMQKVCVNRWDVGRQSGINKRRQTCIVVDEKCLQ